MSLFVLKGEVINRETIRKRKDGSIVDVSVLAYPIILGDNQIGVYGIYSDISERKKQKKLLEQVKNDTEPLLSRVLRVYGDLKFLSQFRLNSGSEQVKHIFKYAYLAECNDNVAKMYGYKTADEIIGTH